MQVERELMRLLFLLPSALSNYGKKRKLNILYPENGFFAHFAKKPFSMKDYFKLNYIYICNLA
jgi:hypothetical protein